MEEPSGSSLSAAESKKWILRIALALLLGQAIWGLVVAVTSSLLVPLIARVMGSDPNSPLYLGKGAVDVPAVFIAIVEFCLAGMVAVWMNSWVQKAPATVRRKAAPAGSLSLAVAPVAAAPQPKPPAAPAASTPVASPVPTPAKPAPAAPPAAAAPARQAPAPATPPKPQKPKEVYYNIVGEPISMDDE